MLADPTIKPYLLRAFYKWCSDQGFTPNILVNVTENVEVPLEHVKDGKIVLNVNYEATNNFKIDNELISFQARFNGVVRDIFVPIENVLMIFSRENDQALSFEIFSQQNSKNQSKIANTETPTVQKPRFKIIK